MAIEQLYCDYDVSYNELHGWISTIQEYVTGIIIDLQTLPCYGTDGQLQLERIIFYYMFWTFDPYVRAFPHYKPLMLVDETW